MCFVVKFLNLYHETHETNQKTRIILRNRNRVFRRRIPDGFVLFYQDPADVSRFWIARGLGRHNETARQLREKRGRRPVSVFRAVFHAHRVHLLQAPATVTL